MYIIENVGVICFILRPFAF